MVDDQDRFEYEDDMEDAAAEDQSMDLRPRVKRGNDDSQDALDTDMSGDARPPRQSPSQGPVHEQRFTGTGKMLAPKLLKRLTFHTNRVNQLFFSHRGDALLSCCPTEPAARLWRWSADFTTYTQKILSAKGDGEEDNVQRPRGTRKVSELELDEIAWSCKDNFVFTGQNQGWREGTTVKWYQAVKVWDAYSGNCLRVLKRHTAQVNY